MDSVFDITYSILSFQYYEVADHSALLLHVFNKTFPMMKICKISGEFSGEFLQELRFLAVKNFFSPQKRWKKIFRRLKVFFHRIERIERKSYTFSSNSPQILHLLAIFSGGTSTRAVIEANRFSLCTLLAGNRRRGLPLVTVNIWRHWVIIESPKKGDIESSKWTI